jgi:hypothetical protein
MDDLGGMTVAAQLERAGSDVRVVLCTMAEGVRELRASL